MTLPLSQKAAELQLEHELEVTGWLSRGAGEMALPLSQRAAEILKQLDYELKRAGDSAYKQSVAWTRFARRAEPVLMLRELAQMAPLPRMVRGSIQLEVER